MASGSTTSNRVGGVRSSISLLFSLSSRCKSFSNVISIYTTVGGSTRGYTNCGCMNYTISTGVVESAIK